MALLVQPGFEVQILPMNMARAPMNNPKLREAIVKAFDYSAFKTFNKGFGQSANSPVPQGLPGWDASIPNPAQDMAAAKQLVAASGVPARHHTRLHRRRRPGLRGVRRHASCSRPSASSG